MTTTLRPTRRRFSAEPTGALSRRLKVCVNSRPVGGIRLSTHPEYGPTVARVGELSSRSPDGGAAGARWPRSRPRRWPAAGAASASRRRCPGTRTVCCGCATTLGYVLSNRVMAEAPGRPGPRTAGRQCRPAHDRGRVRALAGEGARGVRRLADRARRARGRGVPQDGPGLARFLPDGLASENAVWSWNTRGPRSARCGWACGPTPALRARGRRPGAPGPRPRAHPDAAGRGPGGGRRDRIGLNVFAGNTPAEKLYASLGYTTSEYYLYKNLL